MKKSRQKPVVFETEVRQCFQFLVDDYGMPEPTYTEDLFPVVWYERPDLLVSVSWEQVPRDSAGIVVSADLLIPDRHCRADLPDLVEAAVFAPRHKVPWESYGAEVVRRTLEHNAMWLRRLMPLLLGPDREELVRKANDRPLDRAGNPKRRPPGIHWRYA
ncbi:hypothetical protein [Plantactinospora soyae]|uniref:Uncharacterized protein n=1 Tax=Plantactinospora soyae TaxID=1544732 RepID=A0A927RB48_9ACTN|nr:hypothetical protein [Plantactinospora soyae]MBE1491311.1 hypothetical protein [Plantactinospora soyae]